MRVVVCLPTYEERENLEPMVRALGGDMVGDMMKYLRETLPRWNEQLRGWNAPTLTTRKPFDF